MEPKYIVAIVALSLFFLLFLIFFVLLSHRRKMEARLQAWLYERYSSKNLSEVDYDTDISDDAALRELQNGGRRAESEEVQLKIEEAFNKIEIEGIEEITGNYNPQ